MSGVTFDSIYWGATRIDATSGDWVRTVSDIELGVVEYQQFVAPAPWAGGDQVVGSPRPQGRRFAFFVDSVFDGSATDPDGAHADEIEFLTELFNPGSTSATALKTARNNTAGSAQSRQIKVYCTAAYPLNFIGGKDASGIWIHYGSGRIRYKVECYAPWPLWEDQSESSQAFATTPGTAVSNAGSVATGCKIVLTNKSGTVTSLVASNSANAYTTTWTSPANNDAADWNYTDRTGASVVGTVGATSYFQLAVGSNTLTQTPAGGGSFTTTCLFRNEWFTP